MPARCRRGDRKSDQNVPEVRQTGQDNAPGTVLPPRGAITSLLKKPDINRSDMPAPTGDKTVGDMLKTGLQDLVAFRHHAGDSAAEKGEAYIGTAQKGKSEMERLGDMAKDTISRLSGEHMHERHPY